MPACWFSLLDGLTPQLPNGLHPSTVWLPSDPGGNKDADVGSIDWTLPDRLRTVLHRLQEPRKNFWFAINAATWHDRPGNDEEAGPADDFSNMDPYRSCLAATGLTEAEVQKFRTEGNGELGFLEAFYQGKPTKISREKVIDANNGPTPISVRPIRIDGGKAIRLQFTIEICRWIPSPKKPSAADESKDSLPPVRDAGKVKGVISNRWSIRETIDDEWKTHITIEGLIRISDRRYQVDAMRLMTATHLIPYARLASREFFQSPDGLSMSYRYAMVEEGIAPPPATVKWDGTYTEKCINGAITTSTVNAKLIGSVTPPKGVSLREYKLRLLDLLMKLVQHRVNTSGNLENAVPGALNPATQLIKDFTIIESMRRPEVAVNVVIQNTGENMIKGMKLRVNSKIGTTFKDNAAGYDPKWWPIPPLYTWDVESMAGKHGGKLGSAFDQFFQSPTSEWHGKPRGLAVNHAQAGERPSDNDTNAVKETVYIHEFPPSLPSIDEATDGEFSRNLFYWSEQQYEGRSYIQFEAENVTSRQPGRMMFPLSKPRGGETVSIVDVHPGVQYRVYRAVCSRVGSPPKIPVPRDQIGYGSYREVLAKSEIITEPAKPSIDGATVTYTIHCVFKYLLASPPEAVRVPLDPRMSYPSGSDLVAIADIVDPTRIT